MTPLDTAHAAMVADDSNDRARLKFFERVLESELILALDEEAAETLSPTLLDTGAGQLALAFDRDDRLAEYAPGSAYAAVPGRVLIETLAAADLGLGLNLDVAPSAWVLTAEDVARLATLTDTAPAEAQDHLDNISPPEGLSHRLIETLGDKLAKAEGLAEDAYLVTATSASGAKSLMLGFVGTVDGADGALAKAVGEALTFSGEEISLDVVHAPVGSPLAGALGRQGVRIAVPKAEVPERKAPEGPPKLR